MVKDKTMRVTEAEKFFLEWARKNKLTPYKLIIILTEYYEAKVNAANEEYIHKEYKELLDSVGNAKIKLEFL